jgi:hypothetical protein
MVTNILEIKEQPKPNRQAVSFRLLLALYAIIPLCLIIQWVDSQFFNYSFQQSLPSSPKHFILFQILLGTPHIVASAVILTTNSEYFKFYRFKVLMMTLALAIFFGIGSQVFSHRALYVLVASWTVFHVLKQQYGIARGVCRLPEWACCLHLSLAVSAGVLVYIGIFMHKSLDVQQTEWVQYISGGLCLGLFLITVLCHRLVPSSFGKKFMWANTFLVLSSFYLYIQQYYFLAILVPRLVHDATAYVFYVVHDYNRHHIQPQNFLYRWATKCHVNIFIVLPAVSFLLAYVLQAHGDYYFDLLTDFFFGVELRKVISLGLLGYLALMHYYTEAFTWKKDSPYRQFITFKE